MLDPELKRVASRGLRIPNDFSGANMSTWSWQKKALRIRLLSLQINHSVCVTGLFRVCCSDPPS